MFFLNGMQKKYKVPQLLSFTKAYKAHSLTAF